MFGQEGYALPFLFCTRKWHLYLVPVPDPGWPTPGAGKNEVQDTGKRGMKMVKFLNVFVKVLIVVLMVAVFCLAFCGFMAVTGLGTVRMWYLYLLSCVMLGLFVGMVLAGQVEIDV